METKLEQVNRESGAPSGMSPEEEAMAVAMLRSALNNSCTAQGCARPVFTGQTASCPAHESDSESETEDTPVDTGKLMFVRFCLGNTRPGTEPMRVVFSMSENLTFGKLGEDLSDTVIFRCELDDGYDYVIGSSCTIGEIFSRVKMVSIETDNPGNTFNDLYSNFQV
jgi:hypothetical protein